MTHIQFYNTCKTLDDSLIYTCRLVQKVYAQGYEILIKAPDETIGKQLDELLWAFQPTAYIPHTVAAGEHQKINICWDDEPREHHQVLINLSTEIPSWHGRFEKVLEMIYDDSDVIEKKRANFRHYKERGYPLQYHDMSKK